MDFPIIYASGRAGWASLKMEEQGQDVAPILDTILNHVPAPVAKPDAPLQMQVTMLD